jgi:hypothetical protein
VLVPATSAYQDQLYASERAVASKYDDPVDNYCIDTVKLSVLEKRPHSLTQQIPHCNFNKSPHHEKWMYPGIE